MIYSYGFSIVGSSHEKQGTKCQDANMILKLDNGTVIAAVADGVGSCKFSDIASDIAVSTATSFCKDKLLLEEDDILNIIRNAYSEAELAIEKRSLNDDQPLPEYDTTLSLVIYDGEQVYYGHCGDGGIIGLTDKGEYIKITEPQKKEGLFVIPLRAGKDSWVFGKVEEITASVLLATDGVYDIFFPYLLKNQPVEIYVPLIRYFMDNNGIAVIEETIEKVNKSRKDFLNSEACNIITDDKTLVVLINNEIIPEMKDELYYKEPDWDSLQSEWNKKAYPHLYKD